MDKAVWDEARWDYFRWSVYLPIFDTAIEQLKKTKAPSFTDAINRLKKI